MSLSSGGWQTSRRIVFPGYVCCRSVQRNLQKISFASNRPLLPREQSE